MTRRACVLAGLILLGWNYSRPAAAASTDTLVLCDGEADPPTLDPHRLPDNKSDDILFQIFEGLYRVGAEGALEPALATDCRWRDPFTLRCRLRRGAVFHNGDPLDAEAVKWSILRVSDPKTGLLPANELDSIATVEAPDAYTVDIRTKRPDGLLLNRLASFVKIASPKYFLEVGPERFAAAPVGTGPFRFARWEHGRALSLDANPGYWDRGRPRIRHVVFKFLPKDAQLPLLLNGELDAITEVPPTREIEIAAGKRTKIVKQSVFMTPAFWITSFTGPLKDRRVRQALNIGVDKDLLIRYASLGNGKKIATLSMAGEAGHNEELRPYPYSPRLAKKMLTEAGYPKGFALSLATTPSAEREAGIISAEWEKVGIRTTVTTLSLGQLGAKLLAPKTEKFEFDVVANAAPDLASHVYFLPGICFYSRSPLGRLNDAEFDELYDSISSNADPSLQLAAARRLDALIYREAWGIFTYQKIQTYAMNRALDIPIRRNGILDLRDAAWKP